MDIMDIYNPLKLSANLPLFTKKKVLIIGGGAVGSYLVQFLPQLGVGTLHIVDFDSFTPENRAKHSCLVRPEDAGRNKAQALAERVTPYLLVEGGSVNGIDADLCKLGPEILANYDAVFIAVDNYAAKFLFSTLWMRLPRERRPVVIMMGTHDGLATSVILDGRGSDQPCLRCLMDESWARDSHVRTSCVGPQVRVQNGAAELMRASGFVSTMAALLGVGHFDGFVIGAPGVLNTRRTYMADPNFSVQVGHPMKKDGCPDCGIRPVEDLHRLPGSVLDVTLEEAMALIGKELGDSKFELLTHRLFYKNITYFSYFLDDVCHCCGKPIPVFAHESRLTLDDLRCPACQAAGAIPRHDANFRHGERITAFTSDGHAALKKKTLYELGYPLGAHIEVLQRKDALDVIDDGKMVTTVFTFQDDPAKMATVQKL